MSNMRQKESRKNFSTYAGVATGLIIVIGAVFLYRGGGNGVVGVDSLNVAGLLDVPSSGGNENADAFSEGATAGDSAIARGVSTLDAGYENRAFGIRFQHPAAMRISEFNENAGYMILADGGGQSFQIFILPWDEGDGVVSPERIRRDLPNLAIENPQVAELPGGKQGLIFESGKAGMKTRDLWITHGRHLYQITAPLDFDATLAAIMGTWRFE